MKFSKYNMRKLFAMALLFSVTCLAIASPTTINNTTKTESATLDKTRSVVVHSEHRTLTLGKSFIINLPANRTTGYEWTVRKLPNQLEQKNSAYVVSGKCQSGMVGCSGQQKFTLKAVKLGRGILTLAYARSWEKWPATQEKTIVVTVVAATWKADKKSDKN
jgi:inhibitor of cysteine peptidase